MVSLLLFRVPTDVFVALYRFITDYEAMKILGLSSVIAILAGFWRLPPLVKPHPGASLAPYVSERRKQRLLMAVCVASVALTLVTLWLHSLVPSEIGHAIKPPIQAELFRPQLERFLVSLGLVIPVQTWFWLLRFSLARQL